MSTWGRLVAYQVVWFITVINAGHGRAWPGIAAALLIVMWRLIVTREYAVMMRLFVASVVLGTVVDGSLAALGLATYSAASAALPRGGAPLWILALWVAFALTMPDSFGWLRRRWPLCAAIGAVGAPLAYLAAARGWSAVTFTAPAWRGLVCLSAGWAVAMCVLVRLLPRENGGLASGSVASQSRSS